MEYKGYVGRTEVDEEAGLIFGEVIGLRDVVTYQGWSVEEARQAFRESIDLYLQTCAEEGIEPDKPYSGKLLIRTNPKVHRRLATLAKLRDQSLNEFVGNVLARAARKLRTTHLAAPDPIRAPEVTTSGRRKASEAPKSKATSAKRATKLKD